MNAKLSFTPFTYLWRNLLGIVQMAIYCDSGLSLGNPAPVALEFCCLITATMELVHTVNAWGLKILITV